MSGPILIWLFRLLGFQPPNGLNYNRKSTTPRDSLKKAYKVKWISNETAWLNMLRDRNMTSHLYDEAVAKEIFERIKIHYIEMEETYSRLKKKIK